MMDDIFGLLQSKLDPERQLLAAVTAGLQDTLTLLIEREETHSSKNRFGFIPLTLALRHSRKFVSELLDRGTSYPDLFIIWTVGHKMELPLWCCYNPEVIVLLLLVTPHLAAIGDGKMPERMNEHFLMKPLLSGSLLLKTFFATGNRLPAESMDKLANSLRLIATW
ncbi:hypothetical protein CAPTEDRAFT_185640 [Capitella teleta]|uniref:Uncharacterized protein n=1 Tax=Capitella teleta TaxID=283909 RepID=R7UB36_CAPTE|nr:hypothetical protein CAPTEDRAFT_185640 [Capitella teleta]|eukprot:ELU03575.1 hypothetical protein CAPTEDRAFT_185640 [Capitella teleta]